MSGQPAPPAKDALRSVSYDPAFRPAVEAGFLTARQALQRGRRDTWAEKLASRHGLTLDLALAVADNRVSVSRAIRDQRSPQRVASRRPSRVPNGPLRMAAVILGVPLLLFAAVLTWQWNRTGPQETTAGPPGLTRDDSGRVTRIDAADPRTVLEAFCDASSAEQPRDAVGLLKPSRGAPGLRVGILVDPADRERLLAIAIREAPSGRWSAGNGQAPVDELLAPRHAAATLIPFDPR